MNQINETFLEMDLTPILKIYFSPGTMRFRNDDVNDDHIPLLENIVTTLVRKSVTPELDLSATEILGSYEHPIVTTLEDFSHYKDTP